jgi:dihydroxyacid dehydratase/phosphogluconate dehydratase
MLFEGEARVFDGEDGAMAAVLAGEIQPGTVIVIRYEGPKGGPGMREMLAITGALKGAGLGQIVHSLPTVDSAVARGVSVLVTLRQRQPMAVQSRS